MKLSGKKQIGIGLIVFGWYIIVMIRVTTSDNIRLAKNVAGLVIVVLGGLMVFRKSKPSA
jgi:hypothetical protein